MDDKIVVSRDEIDSVVFSVVNQFLCRAKMGKKKYGTDLDRNDLTIIDWVKHTIEEHLDSILYLEKVKQLLLEEKIEEKEKEKERKEEEKKEEERKENQYIFHLFLFFLLLLLFFFFLLSSSNGLDG
jgi:nitrogen fixation/metabolism regulation signal transduction histidine kinase